jgi:hypothetical protein
MVESGFLNKNNSGLTLQEHGIVLGQAGPNEVIVDKLLPGCNAGFEKGDTLLVSDFIFHE